jgi:plastocyanin
MTLTQMNSRGALRAAFVAAFALAILATGADVDAQGRSRGRGRGAEGPAAVENAGKITGKVKAEGAPAPETQLNPQMAGTPYCADSHSEPIFTRRVVVNANSEIKDAFVWVKSGLSGDFPPSKEEVVLDQTGCMYSPDVFGFQAGQKMVIKNSDATLHNVHAVGNDGTGKDYFNLAMPTKDMTLDRTKDFRDEDVIVKFKCEVHPWMFAYAGVCKHPYFAVTDENGSYEIPNLPPGKYTLGVWQRKAGVQEREITVEPNGEATADFTYKFEGEAAAEAAPAAEAAAPATEEAAAH